MIIMKDLISYQKMNELHDLKIAGRQKFNSFNIEGNDLLIAEKCKLNTLNEGKNIPITEKSIHCQHQRESTLPTSITPSLPVAKPPPAPNIIEANSLPIVVTPLSTSLKPPHVPNIKALAKVSNIKLFHNVTHKFNLNDQRVNNIDIDISDKDDDNLEYIYGCKEQKLPKQKKPSRNTKLLSSYSQPNNDPT